MASPARVGRRVVVAAVVATVLLGCGSDGATDTSATVGPTSTTDGDDGGRGATAPSSTASVPTYDGDPGDLLTLSAQGTTDTVLGYSSYEQMRDFSDTVVTATLAGVRIEEPQSDPMRSGTLVATFDVDQVIGGRNEPQPSSTGLEVVLGLAAAEPLARTVLARLEPLYGRATYLMFLNRAIPGPAGEVRYVPTLSSGPPGLLAFWPGDGRLSPVQGRNDLAAEAIERGEQLTGTSDVPPSLGEPVFDGPPPIGLTVEELVATFARPVGTTETEPPVGWDLYLEVLDDALGD